MITDGRYKYVERLFGDHEFYDLLADPGERINLYPQQKDSALVMEYQRAMLHWYQETCDIVPRDYDSRFTEERFWMLAGPYCPPEHEQEIRTRFRQGESVVDLLMECVQMHQKSIKTKV